MAYNVEQLKQLQEDIGSKAVKPDSLDVLNAFDGLKRQAQGIPQSKPQRISQRRNTFQPRTMQEGGQPDMMDDAQNIASKGRYGDTMLMHVTPDEVRGLSSLRGGVTINPETGLPEAFPWLPVLAGAAIGGVGSAATGGDPLKGAAFGALGGFMPTALGGLAGLSPGLTSAWNWLGPIGQGMLSGAAMGGVRGLFGDSDSPLRDILIGGAMGGVTGAMFPQTVEAAGLEGVGYGESARELLGGKPAVSMLGDSTPDALPVYGTNQGIGFQVGDKVSAPALTDMTSSGMYIKPPTDIIGGQSGGWPSPKPGYVGADRFGWEPASSAVTSDSTGLSDDLLKEITKESPVDPYLDIKDQVPFYDQDDPFKALGVERSPWEKGVEWLKERPTWQQAGMVGGAGLLGAAALQGAPEQVEIPGLTTASAIPEVGPFPFRTPIGGRDQEFYERTIGEGRTPEEAAYFTSEDVNVAKEGGLLSVIKRLTGGRSNIPEPGSHEHYAKYGTRGGNAPGSAGYYGQYGTFGDPQSVSPNVNPHLQDPIYGLTSANIGGGDPVPAPFEFPDVTPFQDNVSSFNVEDVLGRITGQDQIAEVPVVVPEQVTVPVPTDIAIPTDTSALGDLLARFQQTAQIDPIASSVSDVVTSSDGGILELAVGGNTSVFEGRVQGQGDGMADQIAFNVIPQTPQDIPNTPDMALLSSDEYVVPADVVSMLGNGSSTAGAQALDQFNQLMRKKAFGTNKQQRELNAGRELSSLV